MIEQTFPSQLIIVNTEFFQNIREATEKFIAQQQQEKEPVLQEGSQADLFAGCYDNYCTYYSSYFQVNPFS